MRWAFSGVMLVRGLLHFIGFAKAFGLGEFPQLIQPISKPLGVAWLVAGIAVLSTAALVLVAPRVWWAVGRGAVLLSQIVIVTAWADAKFGTIANVLLLAGVVYGFASQGPLSFRAEYRRGVDERLSQQASTRMVTEADLAPLPRPVQRYLRVTGALGQPRVHHFSGRWRGRIRATRDDPWMAFTAEQYNFPGEPSRFFLMHATRSGLSVDVFHAFSGQSAAMRVRLASLIPLVDASGPDMNRAETVTLFNDLCLLAPAALIDPSIRWEPIDARSARGHYTSSTDAISAVLSFNEADELVDFVSEDRLAASSDGETFTRRRWSTPVTNYGSFGPWRIAMRVEGRWHPPAGEFVYVELELLDLAVNGRRGPTSPVTQS